MLHKHNILVHDTQLILCIKDFSACEMKILDIILAYANNHAYVFPSQQTIAEKANITVRTVQRALVKFKQLGFIRTSYRHKLSCLYHVSSLFFSPFIRTQLMELLPSLRFLPTVAMRALQSLFSLQGENVVQYNKKVVLNNKPNETYYIQCAKKVSVGGRFFKKLGDMRSMKNIFSNEVTEVTAKAYATTGIPAYIEKISVIELTIAGKIQLCAFPEDAIAFALHKFRNTAKDPFAYLYYLARLYCQQHKIRPRMDHVHELDVVYGGVLNQPKYKIAEHKSAPRPGVTIKQGVKNSFPCSTSRVVTKVEVIPARELSLEERLHQVEQEYEDFEKGKMITLADPVQRHGFLLIFTADFNPHRSTLEKLRNEFQRQMGENNNDSLTLSIA